MSEPAEPAESAPRQQFRHSAPDVSSGGSFGRGSFSSSRKTISFYELAQAGGGGGGAQQGAEMPEVVPASVLMINRRASKSRASFGLPPGEQVKGFDDVMDEKGNKEQMPKLDTIEDVIYALKLATRESIKQLKAGEEKVSDDEVQITAAKGRNVINIDMDDAYYSAPSPKQAIQRSDSIKAAQTLIVALNITVDELKRAELRVTSKEPLSPLHSPGYQEPPSPASGIMLRPASRGGFVPKSPSHKARTASFRSSHYGSGRIRRGSSETYKGGGPRRTSKRGVSDGILGGKRRGTHTGVTKRPTPPKPTGPKRHGSFHQVLHDHGDNRNAVPPGTAMRNHRNSESRRSVSMSIPESHSSGAATQLLSQYSRSSGDLESPRRINAAVLESSEAEDEEAMRNSTAAGKSVVSQVFKDISEPVAGLATPKSPTMLTRPMKQKPTSSLSSVKEDSGQADSKAKTSTTNEASGGSKQTPATSSASQNNSPTKPKPVAAPPIEDDFYEVGTPTSSPKGCCSLQ